MRFVLLDETNGVGTSQGASLTPEVLKQIASALNVQLNRDYGPQCGGNYSVRVGAGAGDIQVGEVVFAILPTLPNAPGDVAYHDVNGNGVPVCWDAITASDTLIGPGNSVSVAISHELLETPGDPGCNLWADGGDGFEYARERCDAVESQSYQVQGVYVSNFLLDSFFVPGAPRTLRFHVLGSPAGGSRPGEAVCDGAGRLPANPVVWCGGTPGDRVCNAPVDAVPRASGQACVSPLEAGKAWPTVTLEGVISGLVGAAATAFAMTWKVAQWARDMAKLEKKFEKHSDEDELFFREARDTWTELKVQMARIEGPKNRFVGRGHEAERSPAREEVRALQREVVERSRRLVERRSKPPLDR